MNKRKKKYSALNFILFFSILYVFYIIIKDWDDFKLGFFGGF